MEDLTQLMRSNYLSYASYVILDRAIPDVLDGLKPVQRRILYTLFKIDDGKFHKVANVVGQAMALHPHGDAAITDALVNLSNKGYFLDQQGNFGNPLTGDPAAASRYIETRLSPLAREALFNPDLTETIPSYDGRNREPLFLPSKLPVLLMQGASGIAVGMSTQILPHNFIELLEAQVAILEGREYTLLPDFPTRGTMDPSEYDLGRGKVKLRTRVHVVDPKTLVIREICYGTTTESLIRSIDEAAKKGKLKIESINDYTAENVEIEIKLPRGQYADEIIIALYAYTECEVSVNSQPVVIHQGMPRELNVNEILEINTHHLKDYLKRELEIEKGRLNESIFQKTLEQIFIENRLYKKIETVSSADKIFETVDKSIVPYHNMLARLPEKQDIERLLQIPIRRISKFDIDKNQDQIKALEEQLVKIENELKNIKKFTIRYLNRLIKTYGEEHPRLTLIEEMETIDLRQVAKKDVKVGYDLSKGFVGTSVKGGETLTCTNFDKILAFFDDGTYMAMNIPDKKFVAVEQKKLIYVGIADKKTIFNICYKDQKNHIAFAKRFVVKQFILDREYQYFDEGMKLLLFTPQDTPVIEAHFIPKIKQKLAKIPFNFDSVIVKGVSAKGIRLSSRGIKRIKVTGGSQSKK